MYERINRHILGSYLPQTASISNINCKDELLRRRLVLLLKKIKFKINIKNDWTEDDYIHFRQKIALMDVEVFKTIFPEMLKLLMLSKQELEDKLRDLDQKLMTHTFDNERIIKNVIDPQTKKLIQQFQYVPHCFSVSDLVAFLNNLISTIHKYDNIVLTYYNNKLKSNGSTEEEQEKIKLLLEMLVNQEPKILNLITNQYQGWVGIVAQDNIIGCFLNKMLDVVIENNKMVLKKELQKLEIIKRSAYNKYSADMKRNYYAYQAKNDIKRRATKHLVK